MRNTDPDMDFIQFLATFRRGQLAEKAQGEMTDLLTAIQATGKGGSLTLKLSIKPSKTGGVEIDPDVSTKRPKVPLATGVYFISDTSGLTRTDPNQSDFDFATSD